MRPPHRTAVALTVTALALLMTAVALRDGAPFGVDTALHRWALEHRTAGATRAFLDITHTGYLGLPFVFAALAGALTAIGGARPADWRRAAPTAVAGLLIGALALALGALLRGALALLLDRPRPPLSEMVYTVSSPAMPSGHATVSALAAIALGTALLRLTRSTPPRVLITAVLALWAVAVGLSRIYLGVHWPTDVLAGWLLATALSLLVLPPLGALLRGIPGLGGTAAATPRPEDGG